MILFGLYIGQRLADVATLRWSNVDLVKGEIRLTTRKTDKVMILPIAAPLRRYLEGLPSSDDVNTPLHPRAFEVVARQGKSGGLSHQFIDLLAQAGIREKQTQDIEESLEFLAAVDKGIWSAENEPKSSLEDVMKRLEERFGWKLN